MINEKQFAAGSSGSHKITFDTARINGGLASEVYIYRFIATGENVNFMHAKKMILLR